LIVVDFGFVGTLKSEEFVFLFPSKVACADEFGLIDTLPLLAEKFANIFGLMFDVEFEVEDTVVFADVQETFEAVLLRVTLLEYRVILLEVFMFVEFKVPFEKLLKYWRFPSAFGMIL
jgi:hypothetical protein